MNAQTVTKTPEDLKALSAPANTDVRTDPEVFRAVDKYVQEMRTISPAVYPFLNTSFGIKELEPNPVDVSNIEPVRLLIALYEGARTRRASGSVRDLEPLEAQTILEKRGGRVNLLAGKELWVDFNGVANYVDARWYDFWNGKGKFQEVVDKVKAS